MKITDILNKLPKFEKKDKSTFPYWFYHWLSYQLTAIHLHAWKFKYLLHDIEKPWLKLFWEYPKVQKWHRIHNSHHLLYYIINNKCDWDSMIIDWECCRYTKKDAPLPAYETYLLEIKELRTFDLNNKTIKILSSDPDLRSYYINFMDSYNHKFKVDYIEKNLRKSLMKLNLMKDE